MDYCFALCAALYTEHPVLAAFVLS